MTDPNSPSCCGEGAPCCGSPAPPARRPRWKSLLFVLCLLAGAALAAHSLTSGKAAAEEGCCDTPCDTEKEAGCGVDPAGR